MIITAAGVSSCKNRGEAKKEKEMNALQLQAMEQKIEENVYPLPTSAEVIKRLSDLDLGYVLGATNPPGSARNYVSSYNRAANLGIYGADLSYATLYKMQQDVIDYLASIRTLANDLNLEKIYDESLYDAIKDSFDDKDSLVIILTDAFNRTYSYMLDAGQANLALLMVAGAWIEGMHLTLSVSESGFNLTGFEQVLLDQKKSFEQFEEIAKPYAEDALVAKMLTAMQPVRDVYATLSTSLTMKDIENLSTAIRSVRAELIK